MRREHENQYLAVPTTQTMMLSPEQVNKILILRLHEIVDRCFLANGKLMQVVGYHPHNGDDVEEEWTGPLKKRRQILAAMTLLKELQ